ncbi:iron chelate uptake ABC transporter family permease subunit [Actinosynnema sp. NPDC047251]|uniref:Putative secreted protein n=1 Tax=Saccharothrix espanaensis (strain ATCC 51144 / DSM 44229 / JCM 9112 / NBRC 15066 / NRRL 15764) TaxID=1179773 RepID=K0JSG2_SACES|nr:iron chelate uptake ABC transporter family permease subunit [Saccharothrix espanaensis]CCH30600.1 putative secreted protein [Saccharothrix espanaensis DSM 44229]
MRLLAAVAVVAVLGSLMLGQPVVLFTGTELEHVVVWQLRAPRLLLGAVAGACLGTAGLLLQESLRNPLAVPELLGVSSGAAAAVGTSVAFGIALPFAPLTPALLGAAVGGGLTLLAVRGATGPAAVLLIGAAVGSACQAVMLAATAMTDSREQGVLVRYLLGSLTGTTWRTLGPVAVGLALAVPAVLFVLPRVRVLRLGDDEAMSAGLRPGRVRMAVLGVASLLVAVVVGPAGPVAWVGFFAPRLAARLGRPSLAVTALVGAVVVVVADLVARTALHPVELPVGGLTALAAVAVGLLVRRRA